jgi:hypothetical protein
MMIAVRLLLILQIDLVRMLILMNAVIRLE